MPPLALPYTSAPFFFFFFFFTLEKKIDKFLFRPQLPYRMGHGIHATKVLGRRR